jgi:hypothetical protein
MFGGPDEIKKADIPKDVSLLTLEAAILLTAKRTR